MKLIWLKVLVIGVLLGGSFAFYSFGTHDVTFDVPQSVSFAEVAERVRSVEAEEEVESPLSILQESEPVVSNTLEASVQESPSEPVVLQGEGVDSGTALPSEVNLDVPFTSQAPFGNWDEVHEETCEEATVLMVHAYYEGQARGVIDPNVAEEVLQDMVESENLIFGYFKDTTVEETAKFAEIYYGYGHVEVLENPEMNTLKRHLAEGRPVIVPTSGRILANPFFSGIGPIYHMVVLKGYTKDGFIVNDPGTRRGADWVYGYDHLMSAIHDWVVLEGIEDHPDDIPVSARRAFVIYPN